MSFAVYIVFLIMSLLRPDMIAPALAAYRPMLLLLSLAVPLALLQAVREKAWAARPAAYVSLAALVLVVGASQLANHWIGGSIHAIVAFLPSALTTLLALLNLTSRRRLRVAALVVVWCMTGLTALSINAYYTGNNAKILVMEEFADAAKDAGVATSSAIPANIDNGITLVRIRSVGLLADPNDFAQMMVVALALLWGLRKPRRPLRNLVFVIMPTGILLAGLYLTHSRGALIGLAAAILVGFGRALGRVRTASLLVVLSAVAVASNFTGGRSISDADASAADRIDFWNLGLHLMAHNPVFGIGFGNFGNYNQLTAHNSFVLCFTELGLVGFFIWVSLLVLSFQSTNDAIRATMNDTEARHLAIGLQASLAGFLACAWFLSRTYEPVLYIVTGLCLAAGHCLSNEGTPRQKWIGVTILCSALLILAVYAFVLGQRVTGH